MSHTPDSIVRLKREKVYDGLVFAAGTLGTVVAPIPSLGAALVLLGHDTTTRLVPDEDLDLVTAVVAAAAPRGRRARGLRAKGLRYGKGDRVKLAEERVYDDVVLPKGSPGTVAAVLASFEAYLVDFDQDSTDRLVPDSALV